MATMKETCGDAGDGKCEIAPANRAGKRKIASQSVQK
jgi:hypothetical protein